MVAEALHAFLSSESDLPFSTALMEIVLHHRQQIWSRTLPCTTGSSSFRAGGCPCALQNSSFQFSPESSVPFCSLQRAKVYLRHCHPTGLLAFCMALLYIRSSMLGTMSSSLLRRPLLEVLKKQATRTYIFAISLSLSYSSPYLL